MLIKKIKNKTPLDRLDDDFVRFYLDEFFKRNYKLKKKFLENKLRKSGEKLIIKNVRNELNKVYGQFWLNNKLELSSHKSTKERKEIYPGLYDKIFKITGEPKRILDLGSGLNALSYSNGIYYIAAELTNYDCYNLRKYFNEHNIKGEVIKSNLIIDRNFPEADICFMFKILDFFDHKTAEELVKSVKAKFIVVSFSTETVQGRKMNYPRRGWLEVMLKRLKFKFEKLEFKNEIFYIIIK